MTEKRTLPLNARQWRVLLSDHLAVLKNVVDTSDVIDEAGIKNTEKHLGEIRMMVAGWYQACAPIEPAADVPAVTNGAAAPKKRGRKSNAERAAMAQAVQ